jgi:hypothetical protein
MFFWFVKKKASVQIYHLFAGLCLKMNVFLGLFNEFYLSDNHFFINGFTHIIDCKQSNTYAIQGFHFHTGLPDASRQAVDPDTIVLQGSFYIDFRELDGVAQRDEFTGSLGPLNASNFGNGEDIAFFHLVFPDEVDGFSIQPNKALCFRGTQLIGFVAYIYHVGFAFGVGMT